MKKTLLSVLALFTFALCNAQVKTQSNYDVDGNGKVTIEDVTSTVNKVLGKAADERTLVDGESLNALLLSIDARLKAIEEKLGISTPSTPDTPEPTDPYNGHEYVDLGLPSGLKWATCNVGANKPEEYGDYFAWGETEPYYTDGHSQDNPCSNWKTNKTGYNWASYKWCKGSSSSQTKYCTDSSYGTVDNKTVLDLEDDAAHVNWGGNWRMPTKEEQVELRENCYWKLVTSYNGKSVNGYIVYKVKDSADKGKMTKINSSYSPVGSYSVSDPHLFLPAAGYRYGSSLYVAGSSGYCWSSSLDSRSPDYAYVLYFFSDPVGWGSSIRQCGQSVRPVSQ